MRVILAVFLFCCCGLVLAETQAPLPTVLTKMLIVDDKIGTGPLVLQGHDVGVTYKGWLFDAKAADRKGQLFDQGLDPMHPLSFTVGRNQVIKGFDQGVTGMHVGGKRTIFIPADMGYGAGGVAGHIPPNAALIFEVEVQAIR